MEEDLKKQPEDVTEIELEEQRNALEEEVQIFTNPTRSILTLCKFQISKLKKT